MSKLEKVYFATKIKNLQNKEFILNLKNSKTRKDVYSIYTKKKIKYSKFIRNGHFILSLSSQNNLHFLKQSDVWDMCKFKIKDSDIFFATIEPTSFGTFTEIGYAVGLNKIPVYVMPAKELNFNSILDFWFVFQLALNTKKFYKESHIQMFDEFKNMNILSVQDYLDFVNKIRPKFLN